MSAARAVWANDLRNIVRDRTVGVLLAVPLLFLVLLRVGYPVVERYVAQASEHRSLVVAVFCLLAGIFPAFLTSFIMLDEKDQGLFPALRVVPVAPARLLVYRLLVVSVLSFLYPMLLLVGSGLVDRSPLVMVSLAMLCAIGSPAATLLVVAVAGNKVEGLTLFKALFFVVALAAVAVLVPGWWTWPVAAVPTFWIYVAFEARTVNGFLASAGVAVAYHVAVVALAWRRFRRQVF